MNSPAPLDQSSSRPTNLNSVRHADRNSRSDTDGKVKIISCRKVNLSKNVSRHTVQQILLDVGLCCRHPTCVPLLTKQSGYAILQMNNGCFSPCTADH